MNFDNSRPRRTHDAVSLTERGLEYPFKMALLHRYGHFQQNDAVLEQMQQFADVWVSESQVPVSMEPLAPEEQAAMASGQFSTFKRTNNPQTGRGGAASGQRGGRRFESNRYQHSQQQHHQDDEKNDETFGSFDPNDSFSLNRTLERPSSDPNLAPNLGGRPSYDRPVMPLRQFKDPSPYEAVHSPTMGRHLSDLEEDGGHDEEAALWSMPVHASRPGTQAAMGVFDDQGRFARAPVASSWAPRPIAAPAPIGSRGFSPQAVPMPFYPPAAYVPPVSTSPPAITAETRWFYRDPSGAVQGPFGNQKMLDWYSRQYFPESLPLRRETDLAFETLTQWKIKCGGQPPFALAALQSPEPKAAAVKPDLALEQRQFLESLTNKSKADVAQVTSQLAQASLQPASQQSAEKTGWATLPSPVVPQPIQTAIQKPKTASPQPISQPATATLQPLPQAPQAPLVSQVAPSWEKPKVAVKSLAEIQQEEAEAAAKAAAEQRRLYGSAPPNSFAALVKKAAATDPVPVPVQAGQARIVTVQSPTADAPIIKSVIQSPPVAAAPSVPAVTSPSVMTASELSKWTLEALKPLAPNFDCTMIACVLADCRTAEDAIAFLRDNVRSKRLNMAAFCRDYAARRWGVQLKEATLSSLAQGQSAGLSSGADEQAEEFVTVSRKSKK